MRCEALSLSPWKTLEARAMTLTLAKFCMGHAPGKRAGPLEILCGPKPPQAFALTLLKDAGH